MPTSNTPILALPNIAAWKTWLTQNSTTSSAVLLTTIQKEAPAPTTTITYHDALDEALCHGWIDSGGRKADDNTHLFRFGRRKATSLWSRRNVGFMERLLQDGRMQAGGLEAMQTAQANGRWEAAYSASSEPPPEFFAALDGSPVARETWEGLSKGNRWHVSFRLLNLKTQAGREKCIRGFVEMLGRGETPLPQKRTVKRVAAERRPSSVSKRSTKAAGSPSVPERRTRSGRLSGPYAT